MKTRQQLFNFIEGQKTAFIASVDEDGFPNIKAMFSPAKMEERLLLFHQHIFHAHTAVYEKSKGKYLFL